MERRQFLKTTLAAATGVAGGMASTGLSAASTAELKASHSFKIIACEEAFTTEAIVAAATQRAGGIPSMTSGLIAGPFLPIALDLDSARIASMDRDGVDVQLLGASSPGVQHLQPDLAVILAGQTNDLLAQKIKQYSGRYAGLASLPMQVPDEAAKEVERAINTLGLNGVVINSHTDNQYLSNEKYWPVLEAIEAVDAALYLHPRDPVTGLADPLNIPGYHVGWGYAVETGTHILHMMAAGVFDRFPNLRMVVGHMGEFIPGNLDRLDNRYEFEARNFNLSKASRKPSEYFLDHFHITTSGLNYDKPLIATIDAVGVERMLFAVDYPFEDQAQQVSNFLNAPITVEMKKQIAEDNPRRVFKINV